MLQYLFSMLLCAPSDIQQTPFYASYQMGSHDRIGSHDPRMLPPQQYGGPFPLPPPLPVSNP